MLEEDKYEDFPEDKCVGGIKELKGNSYCVLCFCKKKCFKEYLSKW